MPAQTPYDQNVRYQNFKIKFTNNMKDALTKAFNNLHNNIQLNIEPDYQISEESTVLKTIEDEIQKLQNQINEVKADGTETRILSYNDKCIKLYAKLDSIADSAQEITESIRTRRKKSYSNLEDLSKQLNELALTNLNSLLKSVMRSSVSDPEIKKLFNEINPINERNKKASIKELDNYRYLLEQIKESTRANNRNDSENRSFYSF